MNVLYEEDGEFRVGTVLSQAPASLQVESPHGRRSKVKAANVVLHFERPAAAELLPAAQQFAAGLDTEFLWKCCAAGEFGFRDLAQDYVGREPLPTEAAGVLLKLHAAPIYFHRRGRGRFQAAPEETVRLALVAVEKKRLRQERIAAWAGALSRFECPAEIAALRDELLYAPQRAKPETKALEQACRETGLSAARLLQRCGLIAGTLDYHLGRFLHEFFPRGTGFPAHPPAVSPADLPLAAVEAFSLDDQSTTEIDDAFSLARVSETLWRIGIHIAAPALGFAPGSPLDAIVRERLSTVYLPGRKYTMLPEEVIECFSLDHGSHQPAMSLYLDVSPGDLTVRARHTRLEQVRIGANLRHARYDALNALFECGGCAGLPYEDELRDLWRLACALEQRRGKASVTGGALDYLFRVDGERVTIELRRRGAPLDKLVSELMILANSTWGELLAERDVAAIYRVQSAGKVRLSVHPEAHDGLGVGCYAWMTSPLRRYVDLLNQWQLVAALGGKKAPFARNSEGLLGAIRDFELVTARYDEHQRALEHYWCLRWLEQVQVRTARATVLRENVVRFDALPLTLRVATLPGLDPGTRVLLEIDAIDLLECRVACRYRETLAGKDEAAAPQAPGPG
jgi:exoribonuclease-2